MATTTETATGGGAEAGPRWHHRFRARLILAVFPVVAGVTAAAVLLAEARFRAAYERSFEGEFEEGRSVARGQA